MLIISPLVVVFIGAGPIRGAPKTEAGARLGFALLLQCAPKCFLDHGIVAPDPFAKPAAKRVAETARAYGQRDAVTRHENGVVHWSEVCNTLVKRILT
jgi:hypothetical protein